MNQPDTYKKQEAAKIGQNPVSSCSLCRKDSVVKLLDLGDQPICNRFLIQADGQEYRHPMVIGQCHNCGLVQIINPLPARELLSPFQWITYNEPEDHLDQLVETIIKLPGLHAGSKICGISFKDNSTLARLKKKGFKAVVQINPKTDLSISEPGAGVETIQDRLTEEKALEIVEKHGKFDVVIARHILEHAGDLAFFINVLKQILSAEGYIVFEVPDCSRSFEERDFTTLWEEHFVYFTPATFRQSFAFGGLALVRFESYPYAFENSLVGIAKLKKDAGRPVPSVDKEEELRARDFCRGFEEQKAKVKAFLANFNDNQGKVAFFGAGHLACVFINFFELKAFVEFVVDDNPNKESLFMPGSRLPIYPSTALADGKIKLCLLSLNPLSEDRVIQNNRPFIENGGRFESIIPASRYALKI